MRTYLECIPCFFKHALVSSKIAKASQKQQRRILSALGEMIDTLPLSSSPPEIARLVNDMISEVTGKDDVYKQIKQESNARALQMYPALKKRVDKSSDPLLMAVECAIAGNVIDYGIHDAQHIEAELVRLLKEEKEIIKNEDPGLFAYPSFKKALKNAKTIVYLGDNAGETVFDRLLIETIHRGEYGEKEIVYVVREEPAINDALAADAIACGLPAVAEVMSSGSDAPGTVLTFCSQEFCKVFKQADMVISKGQGNFEALSDEKREIFFLLMVKCPVIAEDIKNKVGACSVGDTVLLQTNGC